MGCTMQIADAGRSTGGKPREMTSSRMQQLYDEIRANTVMDWNKCWRRSWETGCTLVVDSAQDYENRSLGRLLNPMENVTRTEYEMNDSVE